MAMQLMIEVLWLAALWLADEFMNGSAMKVWLLDSPCPPQVLAVSK